MRWMGSREICEYFQISPITLKSYKDSGRLKYRQLSSRKFLYDPDSLEATSGEARKNVIYARVSNSKQQADLEHQTKILTEFMNSNGVIVHHIFSDIASGMNENRPNFIKLLKLVIANEVDSVYITYKDRLTRFGFDYFSLIFGMFGTKIVIINQTEEASSQTELTEDLVAIIHHFSMKMYSRRRAELNKIKKQLLEETTDL
jgi:predicted site-specific integrase-resolvase